jgi:hypothetical protein
MATAWKFLISPDSILLMGFFASGNYTQKWVITNCMPVIVGSLAGSFENREIVGRSRNFCILLTYMATVCKSDISSDSILLMEFSTNDNYTQK